VKEDIARKLRKIVQTILESRGVEINSNDEIDLNASLQEEGIGLGSIEILTLMGEIEKQFNVEIPEKFWGSHSFQNLNGIIDFLPEQKPEPKN
jgi:acyl carrier protein